jgi:hypothetical protein
LGEWFCVDGLAGSGVNRIDEEGGRLISGMPAIAFRTEPQASSSTSDP